MNIKSKEFTELLLDRLATEWNGLSYNSCKTNTLVLLDGSSVVNIYYRVGAVRMDVRISSAQYFQSKAMLKRGIIYQKYSANPYAAKGKYAFFVDLDKVEEVLIELLECK